MPKSTRNRKQKNYFKVIPHPLTVGRLFPLTLPLLLPPTLPVPPPTLATLSLLELSTLLLVALALLLLLLSCLSSPGSLGSKPEALANRFRISVRLTTPERRPESEEPGMWMLDAVTEVVLLEGEVVVYGGPDAPENAVGGNIVFIILELGVKIAPDVSGFGGGFEYAGVRAGVGGPEDAGEGGCTTHILCERVATSLATVWARVEKGFTWKTG